MTATWAPARSSRSVNGRPDANSAPTISKKSGDAPSTSTLSDSRSPERAVSALLPTIVGTITCTATARTARASRAISAANEGFSGSRLASASEGVA